MLNSVLESFLKISQVVGWPYGGSQLGLVSLYPNDLKWLKHTLVVRETMMEQLYVTSLHINSLP